MPQRTPVQAREAVSFSFSASVSFSECSPAANGAGTPVNVTAIIRQSEPAVVAVDRLAELTQTPADAVFRQCLAYNVEDQQDSIATVQNPTSGTVMYLSGAGARALGFFVSRLECSVFLILPSGRCLLRNNPCASWFS